MRFVTAVEEIAKKNRNSGVFEEGGQVWAQGMKQLTVRPVLFTRRFAAERCNAGVARG